MLYARIRKESCSPAAHKSAGCPARPSSNESSPVHVARSVAASADPDTFHCAVAPRHDTSRSCLSRSARSAAPPSPSPASAGSTHRTCTWVVPVRGWEPCVAVTFRGAAGGPTMRTPSSSSTEPPAMFLAETETIRTDPAATPGVVMAQSPAGHADAGTLIVEAADAPSEEAEVVMVKERTGYTSAEEAVVCGCEKVMSTIPPPVCCSRMLCTAPGRFATTMDICCGAERSCPPSAVPPSSTATTENTISPLLSSPLSPVPASCISSNPSSVIIGPLFTRPVAPDTCASSNDTLCPASASGPGRMKAAPRTDTECMEGSKCPTAPRPSKNPKGWRVVMRRDVLRTKEGGSLTSEIVSERGRGPKSSAVIPAAASPGSCKVTPSIAPPLASAATVSVSAPSEDTTGAPMSKPAVTESTVTENE
mmetsp:Transcript_23529/g.56166  ORF Transcript_23529/g.56166 Transcript_23529/m.56166 type:complete len:422 (-) Transcript_23529:437-1702(-)